MQSPPLKIILLPKDDLALYLLEEDLYENKYQLNSWGRTVPSVIRSMVVEGTLPGVDICSPQQLAFYSLWIAIDPATDNIVAELQLKGLPDNQGYVEIGYETFEPFQKKGYMAVFIQEMIKWASSHSIKGFIAETLTANSASIQLLKKLGFIPVKQLDQIILWKKKF